MMIPDFDLSRRNTARLAGVLYLLLAITGAFSMLYVTETLVVPSDPAATVSNITESETLFRLGIVSGLVSPTLFVLMALTLYKLFADVSRPYASLLVTFVAFGAVVTYVNMLNLLAVTLLLDGSEFLGAFEPAELEALVMVFLGIHDLGIKVATLFWGLWLFPFGVLVYRSGFIPRPLGVLLIVGAVGYVLNVLVLLVVPNVESVAVVGPVLVVLVTAGPVLATLGEFSMIVWLLVKGTSTPDPRPGASREPV